MDQASDDPIISPGAVCGERVRAVPDVRRLVAVDGLAPRRRAVPPLVHVAHQLGMPAIGRLIMI